MPLMMKCSYCGTTKSTHLVLKEDGFLCKSCGVFTYDQDEIGEEKARELSRLDIGYEALRGYHFRDAKECFQNICRDFPKSVEALWGLLLAKFGITYVKGFYNGAVTPIYCFPEYDPENVDYFSRQPEFQEILRLLEKDREHAAIYRKKAEEIDAALDLFADSQEEEPIDIFICVKISQASENQPNNTEKTELDFPKAQELVQKLGKNGQNVFFSFESLQNNPKSDMEIWTNLLRSKKMLLIASKKDYLESVWVKSEWERWLYLDIDGDHSKNLYIYLLGDAKKLARKLPEGLFGRQFYTEERESKLIADICGKTEEILQEEEKTRASEEMKKQFLLLQEEMQAKMRAEMQAQLEARLAELTKETKEKEAALQREKAAAEARAKAEAAARAESEARMQAEMQARMEAESRVRAEAQAKAKAEAEAKAKAEAEVQARAKAEAQAISKAEAQAKAKADGKIIFTDGSEEIIPYGTTEIKENAYYENKNVKEVILPNTVTGIGCSAFKGCSGLTRINIPSSVTNIGAWAFWDCSNLTRINIPNSVTSIGNHAFCNCSNLTSINIPSSVTSIGKGAFSCCSGLTRINIPSSVTNIGDWAFYACSNLTNINIPSSVTSIDNYAFDACKGLTSITIPSSVTNIGEWAFSDCNKLTIRAPKGSEAERYAKRKNIPFVAI